MTREQIILTFVLTICFISCGQTKTENKNLEKITHFESSVITVLPFDTTKYWIFKNSNPTGLSADDLEDIEIILTKCINAYNSEQEKKFKEINNNHPEYKLNKKDFIIDLTRYKRQYVAITNSKDEKEVWINCFCDAWNVDVDWRKELIMVFDGGNCYFNLKINLTTGKYYELMVNGEA